MSLFKYLYNKDSVKRKILDIKDGIGQLVKPVCTEKVDVIWYGAYDINPKHLVFWICVQTDRMKTELASNDQLKKGLRDLLEIHQYPVEAQPFVHMGFESKETVDRDSGGNWYHHFK